MKPRRILLSAAVLCLAAGSAAASTVIGLSIEDQARLSKLIVVGQIVGQQGVDHPDNGLETEVTFLVTDVFKGTMTPGQSIQFYTRSGELNGEISRAAGEAVFQVGQTALVFMEEVDGRAYNLGLSMGVWNVQVDEKGRTSFTRALQDGLEVVGGIEIERGPLWYRDMASRVAWTLTHPEFDNAMLRETFGQGR